MQTISDKIKLKLPERGVKDIAKQYGIAYEFLRNLRENILTIAPDSKYLPALAQLLTIPEDQLRKQAEREKLNEHSIKKFGKPASEIYVCDDLFDSTVHKICKTGVVCDNIKKHIKLKDLPVAKYIDNFTTDNPDISPYEDDVVIVCENKPAFKIGHDCLFCQDGEWKIDRFKPKRLEGCTTYHIINTQ